MGSNVNKESRSLQRCEHDASPQTFILWVQASTKARFEEAYRGNVDKLEFPSDMKVDVS